MANGKGTCSMEVFRMVSGLTKYASIKKILQKVCAANGCHGLPTDADVLWIDVSISSLVHLGTIRVDGIAKSQTVLICHSMNLRANSWVSRPL